MFAFPWPFSLYHPQSKVWPAISFSLPCSAADFSVPPHYAEGRQVHLCSSQVDLASLDGAAIFFTDSSRNALSSCSRKHTLHVEGAHILILAACLGNSGKRPLPQTLERVKQHWQKCLASSDSQPTNVSTLQYGAKAG